MEHTRRSFLTGVSLAMLACPLARPADARDPKRVVGVLTPGARQWRDDAFRDELGERGYRDGENITVDVRSADDDLRRMDALARDLVARGPHVIVGVNTPGTRAALAATKRVPIVMAMVGDPVALGFVTSLARPTGNVTGLSNMVGDLAAKRLDILREAVPGATRIALLAHPDEPIVAVQMRDLEPAGRALGVEYRLLAVRTREDLSRAFDAAAAWRAHAVLRLAGQASAFGTETAQLALQRRLPTMLFTRRDVEAGGLMSYYIDDDAAFRRVAWYVARLLGGAKPVELPVEQPAKFELVINLRTARALALTIPPSLLLRADHVIE
jgi:putative ABC transport system substrate-binding protein